MNVVAMLKDGLSLVAMASFFRADCSYSLHENYRKDLNAVDTGALERSQVHMHGFIL